jgi:hypothetical protein
MVLAIVMVKVVAAFGVALAHPEKAHIHVGAVITKPDGGM